MSLFGTSPDDSGARAAAAKSRSSLFDDEPTQASGSKSSLFADDENVPGMSPWGLPTPKKAARGELVKTLLPASEVPEGYVDLFDNVVKSGHSEGGKISSSGVSRVLSAGNLSGDDQARVLNVIAPGGQVTSLGRSEFNVLLALIGLAQEHEEISLDGVDERRRNLPVPALPALNTPTMIIPGVSELAAKPPQLPNASSQNKSLARPRTMQKNSFDAMDADPWGSPGTRKNHNYDSVPKTSSMSRSDTNGISAPVRTTSNFTTASVDESTNGNTHDQSAEEAATPTGDMWGSYDGGSSSSFNAPAGSGIGGDGFGGGSGGDGNDNGDQQAPAPAQSRSFGGGRMTGGGIEEIIQISLLPEKEGMFLFQHRNYQVSSSRRGSKVVRRYSDFVWLLDCLQKRYPFRQLPLLPPKRVGVNGNHLAADNSFIEKRRRGLVRFCNALVRHPVLNQEQLVIMFLTVPTDKELAVWRKQATISVQEEFSDRALPPGLEDSLPPTLDDLFETSRTGVRRSAEIYITLCNLLDRMAKRNEGLAADHSRLSSSLQSLTEATQDTYATDTNDVPLLNEGLNATAKHLSNTQSLLEDEARAWDEGVLEDLKRQRDALVSLREMFDRRDRYDKDNIPYLEKRIQTNEGKLTALRSKPELKPGEVERVTEAIIKDKQSIVEQHARSVFIKECIRDELIFFQQSQFHVSRWNQDWAQERVKYSELHADNWKQLHEELESMPLGE